MEPPSYQLHDVYRALSVLAGESDFIQSEVYKNSRFLEERNDRILYYDCTNYYFETEQEEDDKKYGKSKEHRPNPIVQMGLFTDGGGIPLAFSLFPGSMMVYRLLEKSLGSKYTCEEILSKLKEMNFADIEEQGFMPLYRHSQLTDALHDVCGFRTDYQFIPKSKMRNIQKKSKRRE